jgi:hypothetical protein
MESFESLRYGIRGLAPAGWKMTEPGRFEHLSAEGKPQVLFFETYTGVTAEQLAEGLAGIAGLDSLPGQTGEYRAERLTWALYAFDMQVTGYGTASINMGLSEDAGSFYLAVLVTDPSDAQQLYADYFERALAGIAPIAADDPINQLTADMLLADHFIGTGPVLNALYAPSEQAGAAHHQLEGTLTVHEFGMGSSPGSWLSGAEMIFPGFSVPFITVGNHLVPVERELLNSTGLASAWRIILSPGRVWSESGDGDMSRASFPFVLASRTTSAAHNGLATFLFDDTSVSGFRFQVVQEIVPWSQPDFWGQLSLKYVPGPVPRREEIAASLREELASRLPSRPWSDLSDLVDPGLLSSASGNVLPEFVSAAGAIVDGTFYLQPCRARYGSFPYCAEMRHGSFSVSKSMGAGIAMLRLAEKYGEDVFDLKIVDYVNVTATHDGWRNVTFGDVLNMATGVGTYGPDRDDPSQYLADDGGELFNAFTNALSAQEKLDVAFSYGNYDWGPGEVARYNSSQTFILSAAMQAFLQSREGPDADIWDTVLEEVFQPIGVAHAPIMRTIEPDGSRGLPLFGWGMYPTVDDTAKIALLLVNAGNHDGEQLLHAGKIAEALRQTGYDGLPTGEIWAYGEGAYHMSFWSVPYVTTDGRQLHVPYMSGFGGNRVLLHPNGVVTFRFSDGQDYETAPMIRLAEALAPFP